MWLGCKARVEMVVADEVLRPSHGCRPVLPIFDWKALALDQRCCWPVVRARYVTLDRRCSPYVLGEAVQAVVEAPASSRWIHVGVLA